MSGRKLLLSKKDYLDLIKEDIKAYRKILNLRYALE
jgi:hypothetical protein